MNLTQTIDLTAWDEHLKATRLDRNENALLFFLRDYVNRLTVEESEYRMAHHGTQSPWHIKRLRHIQLWMDANKLTFPKWSDDEKAMEQR